MDLLEHPYSMLRLRRWEVHMSKAGFPSVTKPRRFFTERRAAAYARFFERESWRLTHELYEARLRHVGADGQSCGGKCRSYTRKHKDAHR